MAKKILVIGGTYFLGKAFVQMILKETDCEVTIMHRGTAGAKIDIESERLTEIFGDRHDGAALRELPGEHYDAVVDFCAYIKGDISFLLDRIKATVDHYIFISTVDVYQRGLGRFLEEDAPLETRSFGGTTGDYISGKVALESEIKEACAKKGCEYTVLRPAIIFGPENYAPREGMYFYWIGSAGQVLSPTDSDGEFQLVYVKDAARAIKLVMGNPAAYGKAFNVCENKTDNYESFCSLLKEATGEDFEILETRVEVINEKNIPLPFPLTKEESNYYDGKAIAELGLEFTDKVSAMKETYQDYLRRNS